MEKSRRNLEGTVEEQRVQIEELEDELQAIEDAKLRLEVNMQALKSQYEREIQGRDEQGEDKKRALVRQLRDMEAELEEERKQRMTATGFRKKYEADIIQLQEQVDLANKTKEDAVKQLRRSQMQFKDFQREMEENMLGKDEMATLLKERERKAKALEAELLQAQEDVASSERYRRAAEQERDELQEEMSNNTTSKYVVCTVYVLASPTRPKFHLLVNVSGISYRHSCY